MSAASYQWNQAEIASDVVDGEAVIIHLTDGTYYSLDRAGTVIWEALASPRSPSTLADSLVTRYGIAQEQARADSDALVTELVRERLVIASAGNADTTPLATAPAHDAGFPYSRPHLSKYTDMADMLALDPPLPGVRDLPWKTPAE